MGNKLVQGLGHSKNRLNAAGMETGRKHKAIVKNHSLPGQSLKHLLPNLQEATFKADKLKSSGFEAYGVEINCKFQLSNPHVAKTRQIEKEKTVLDKLWLFIVKQSITAFFQLIILKHSQLLPYILFLIFSLVPVV
ncbi:MAG: hypothetical protein LBU82_05070 [Treponema sp.]|jgi:hypothetical protein|nr:hypothetical protein [Treponema sp.]